MTEKISVEKLTEAQETLLIPLWARAREASHPSPILRDQKAVELVDAIDYDFHRFETTKVDVAGFCVRAAIFDGLVRGFLDKHPSATIFEIGPGLDTRFDRLYNGQAQWIELDLPDAMEVRRLFFQESDRRRFISSSVIDPEWIDTVKGIDSKTLLFVAEGVFHFLTRKELTGLFSRLADHFPGARVLFDSQSPFYRIYANLWHPVRDAKLLLTIGNIKEIEQWDSRFKIEEWIGFGDSPHYDQHRSRLPWLHRMARMLYPPTRSMFKTTIVRLG